MIKLEGLPYAVTRMDPKDVPAVGELERIVFTLPWSSATFNYELNHNPSAEYLVLRYLPWAEKSAPKSLLPEPVRRLLNVSQDDQSLLGYGGFWMMLDEAHICTLAVRPEWRGRGLGELLLASLIERAFEREAKVVTLEVRVSNFVAQNLYEKYGFKVVGQRKGYYSDNHEDALIMTTDVVTSPEYQRRFRHLTERLSNKLRQQPHTPPVTLAKRA